MRAALKPLTARGASLGAWALGAAIVIVAGSALSLSPRVSPFKPGSAVSYCEDRLGRPWKIVRRTGYQTFEIRNGQVLVIAGADDLSAYHGYSTSVTVRMAGQQWRDKVLDIQRTQRRHDTVMTVSNH